MNCYRLMGIGWLLILASGVLLWFSPPPSPSEGISGYTYATDIPLSGWEDHRLQRKPGETDRDFATRLNGVIAATIYHCDNLATPRLIDKLVASYQGSIFENLGLVTPGTLKCGMCGQVAYVLARALNLGGVSAIPLEAQYWIADPDMGMGLFLYHDDMWGEVKESYMQLPHPSYNRDVMFPMLEKAFKTTADDQPWMERPMEWINQVELQQRNLIKVFEYFSYGMFFLGLALLFTCFFQIKKKRAK
jgi:hypothetical protein